MNRIKAFITRNLNIINWILYFITLIILVLKYEVFDSNIEFFIALLLIFFIGPVFFKTFWFQLISSIGYALIIGFLIIGLKIL